MENKITLRQYQQDAINAVLNEPIGSKVILALAVGLRQIFYKRSTRTTFRI